MRLALWIGAALSAVLVALLVAAWLRVDSSSSSTAALAYAWIPIWGFLGLVVIWSGVLVAVGIDEWRHKRRYGNRNAKPF